MLKLQPLKINVLSWALYDFASTIFSMNIVSLYFPLWVTVQNKAPDITYGIAISISMLLSAFLNITLGTISDMRQNKRQLLIIFACLACVFCGLMGAINSLFAGLALFMLANAAYQTASVFYNSLLSDISEKDNVGIISGIGASLGYIGTISGLIIVGPIVLKHGYHAAFTPTAILFFVFSVPCFIFVKEKKIQITGSRETGIKTVLARIKQTFNDDANFYHLKNFLISSFFFMNAVNTLILFMSVYIKKVVGFSDKEIHQFYIISTIFTAISSYFYGFITDKLGAYKSMRLVLFAWLLGLGPIMFSADKTLFWIMGPVAGIALGATWVASRALIIHLCPKEKLGEVFGIFGLTGKVSGMLGPLIWGAVILLEESFGTGIYRVAVLTQVFLILLSLPFFRRADTSKPRYTPP